MFDPYTYDSSLTKGVDDFDIDELEYEEPEIEWENLIYY